jgi:hypothetical protein
MFDVSRRPLKHLANQPGHVYHEQLSRETRFMSFDSFALLQSLLLLFAPDPGNVLLKICPDVEIFDFACEVESHGI